jgi:hypothetical protein
MRALIIYCIAMLCATITMAQTKVAIPANVKAAFAKQYTTATHIKWEKEHDKYEVSFNNSKQHMSVLYNDKGVAEEIETAITISQLPVKAAKYAEAKGKIKEAAIIEKADGTKVFEAEVNHTDYLFDMNGNFLKEVKE